MGSLHSTNNMSYEAMTPQEMTLYQQMHTKLAKWGVDVIMPPELCEGCGAFKPTFHRNIV